MLIINLSVVSHSHLILLQLEWQLFANAFVSRLWTVPVKFKICKSRRVYRSSINTGNYRVAPSHLVKLTLIENKQTNKQTNKQKQNHLAEDRVKGAGKNGLSRVKHRHTWHGSMTGLIWPRPYVPAETERISKSITKHAHGPSSTYQTHDSSLHSAFIYSFTYYRAIYITIMVAL